MTGNNLVRVSVTFDGPDLEMEEKESETLKLL
jgi:hypothetical protein